MQPSHRGDLNHFQSPHLLPHLPPEMSSLRGSPSPRRMPAPCLDETADRQACLVAPKQTASRSVPARKVNVLCQTTSAALPGLIAEQRRRHTNLLIYAHSGPLAQRIRRWHRAVEQLGPAQILLSPRLGGKGKISQQGRTLLLQGYRICRASTGTKVHELNRHSQ